MSHEQNNLLHLQTCGLLSFINWFGMAPEPTCESMDMTKKLEIHVTVTLGVKSPRLTELKERECSLPELQAALVQLIEIFNASEKETAKLADRVAGKQDREWRATI